jgi:hypothetical protein
LIAFREIVVSVKGIAKMSPDFFHLIIEPAVGRPHEILILDIDETFGSADGGREGPGD